MLTLTDAATLAGCSRKALERRVERGSLVATRDDDGQRRVRVADLLRAGLVTLAPACAEPGAAPEVVLKSSRILRNECSDEASVARLWFPDSPEWPALPRDLWPHAIRH